MRDEPLEKLRLRKCRAIEETLQHRAAHLRELLLLSRGLDAFGDGFHVQSPCQLDHRLDNRFRAVFNVDVPNERPVDFDLVERECLKIAERRIACAKVVERNLDAEGFELSQGGEYREGVVQKYRLG